MEDEEVFRITHAKLLELHGDGLIDGFRIDHPDGLANPRKYLDDLRDATGGAWVVVEKILEPAETLPDEVLAKMHAPPKSSSIPVLTNPEDLTKYDALLFGIPTRYGNFPAQWKAFWDKTGGIWATGGYWGKYAGLFVSTGTQGGGQESTALAAMSTLAHHGLIYVPLGYKTTFGQLSNLSEVHGGSAWGAGTFVSLYHFKRQNLRFAKDIS